MQSTFLRQLPSIDPNSESYSRPSETCWTAEELAEFAAKRKAREERMAKFRADRETAKREADEAAYRAKVDAAVAAAKAATDAARQSEFRIALLNAAKFLVQAESLNPDQAHAINLILLDVKNLAS